MNRFMLDSSLIWSISARKQLMLFYIVVDFVSGNTGGLLWWISSSREREGTMVVDVIFVAAAWGGVHRGK